MLPKRIKYRVVEDTMLGWPDPRNHRCMTWVGDSRDDAYHALGVAALFEKGAEDWNFQAVLIRLRNILRFHAIDRDQHEWRRLLSGQAGASNRKAAAKKSGQSAERSHNLTLP